MTLNYIYGEASFLEQWRARSAPSLPLFQGSFWPEVVFPVRVPSMRQIDLFENNLYLIEILDVI